LIKLIDGLDNESKKIVHKMNFIYALQKLKVLD